MNNYVVGFAFSEDKRRVLLVKKKRPEWQKGALNGIGGKIEEGEDTETPYIAMHRETKEETGLVLDWYHRGVMQGTNNDGSDFSCHIFCACSDDIWSFVQVEDEVLAVWRVDLVRHVRHISNLEFILPYLLCEDSSKFIHITY